MVIAFKIHSVRSHRCTRSLSRYDRGGGRSRYDILKQDGVGWGKREKGSEGKWKKKKR